MPDDQDGHGNSETTADMRFARPVDSARYQTLRTQADTAAIEADEQDGHGNGRITDAVRRALDAWVTCAQETIARQRALTPTPGAARRIKEERLWKEQQRAACERTEPEMPAHPESRGHGDTARPPCSRRST